MLLRTPFVLILVCRELFGLQCCVWLIPWYNPEAGPVFVYHLLTTNSFSRQDCAFTKNVLKMFVFTRTRKFYRLAPSNTWNAPVISWKVPIIPIAIIRLTRYPTDFQVCGENEKIRSDDVNSKKEVSYLYQCRVPTMRKRYIVICISW